MTAEVLPDWPAKYNGLMRALSEKSDRLNGMMSAYQKALAQTKAAEDDAARLRAALAAEQTFANLRPDAILTVPATGPAVYVLRSATTVLYVGMTDSVMARIGQHAIDKPWWPEVVTADIYNCESRGEAAKFERQLIAFLGPLHNVIGMQS